MIVTDGFTGNVALKVMEGTSSVLLGAVRDAATSSTRSKAGGLLLKPALRELRDQLDPQAVGGAVLLGLRKLVVVPHGSFEAEGITTAIGLAARGVREDVVGRTLETLAPPERCGALPPRCPPWPLACRAAMTREEILEAIRAHLADELELDPARIDESTHFKRDLEADSLDLYTLVQELEDTYGVAMTDEQAARIQTVGAAVDFVVDSIAAPVPHQDGGWTATLYRGPDPEPAQRPAGSAAAGSRAAGDHARVVDGAALGLLRAAGVPGRLGARPGGHDAPVSAAGGGVARRRAADQDPRAGGLGPLVPRVAERLGLPERLRAAAPPEAGEAATSRWCAPSGCWPR